MAYLDDLKAHVPTLLRGATLLLGGAALVLVGTFVGYQPGRAAQVAAGTIGVTGVVTMFLGFFLYVLPPLLPAK